MTGACLTRLFIEREYVRLHNLMWFLEENRCEVNLEVGAAESKIMAKRKDPQQPEDKLQNTAIACGRGKD